MPSAEVANPGAVSRWWRSDGAGGWQQVSGYPAHMNDYVALPSYYDHGGVPIYSNINQAQSWFWPGPSGSGRPIIGQTSCSLTPAPIVSRLETIGEDEPAIVTRWPGRMSEWAVGSKRQIFAETKDGFDRALRPSREY